MSRSAPASDCHELAFHASYPVDEPAEVALEDYVRVLMRARAAEALRAADQPGRVRGIHVCGPAVPLDRAAETDIEDFARDLATHGSGGGLGWS